MDTRELRKNDQVRVRVSLLNSKVRTETVVSVTDDEVLTMDMVANVNRYSHESLARYLVHE